uniref:DNA polymerase n=2 Tax=unclassified bacterial viruses TaxID=12333 RepID=A0AAU6W269_9VIRU
MTMKYSGDQVRVSDIETNGLLQQVTRFHCAVSINPFTLEEWRYEPSDAQTYTSDLQGQAVVVGHNYRGYDLLALAKLFEFQYPGFCFDTLVLSRLLNPERKLHSLEAWGKQLRYHKGTFGQTSDWAEFSKEMLLYCVDDVRLNAILFLYFIKNLGWYDWFGATKQDCIRNDKAIREGDLRIIT